MGRPRKPTAVHELTGSFKKNPKRGKERENEPQPTAPLGPPPVTLPPTAQAIWFELEAIVPPKVLTNADRWTVEIAATLMYQFRQGTLEKPWLPQLMLCLSKLGLNPTDRSKIAVPPENKPENPFAEFSGGEARPN